MVPETPAETEDIPLISHSPDRVWCVARTKARSEKKLAAFCQYRNIRCYLPLRRKISRYRTSTRESMIPMFTGYLFIQVNPEEREMVIAAPSSATIIVPSAEMEQQLVNELNDIRILTEATQEGEMLVREELKVGRIVTIRTGALRGLSGIVRQRRGKARITVNVEMIGQSVSVEIDVGEVELEY